jgi:hypothetical protein
MRAREFGMPRVWLPDIDPDASNTIIASSVHGAGFFSSEREAEPFRRRKAIKQDPTASTRDNKIIPISTLRERPNIS